MTTKKFRLTKLDLGEISLVGSGDDPTASVLIAKVDPDTVEKCGRAHDKLRKGRKCSSCGYIAKGMPTGDSLHVLQPLDNDFKHSKKLRRKKRQQLLMDPPII